MNPSVARPAASPFRRRRIIWSILILSVVSLFYLSTHTPSFSLSLPESLKDLGFSASSSRVSKVGNAKADAERRLKAQEIHGLLHFVTAYPNRRLDEEDGTIDVAGVGHIKVDPKKTVDMRVYSPNGDDNWAKHLKALKEDNPLVVFSKTYCPYSLRVENLLKSYSISPPPVIIELDTRSDGPIIQEILKRLTKRATVPNVILQATSIGGSDDVHELDERGELKKVLTGAGLKIHAS